jgi:hypothetical protein
MPVVGNMSGSPRGKPGPPLPTRFDSLRLLRPSIFRRNPERGLPAMAGARVEGLNGDISEPGHHYFP